MIRNKLVLADGTVIDSSTIMSCEYVDDVNSDTNLTVGDTTSAEVTVEFLNPGAMQNGDVFDYYIIEDGVEHKVGRFTVNSCERGRRKLRVVANDNLLTMAKNVSPWLKDHLDSFPMTAKALATAVCQYCGVTFGSDSFLNESVSIPAFYGENITCRQVISWIAQIAGCFVRADANGAIVFDWFKSNSAKIGGADGVPFKGGSLKFQEYVTDVIERVQLRQSDDDVGVIYPADATGNTMIIQGNSLMASMPTDTLTTIAQSIYNKVHGITYNPLEVGVWNGLLIRPGDIISVYDIDGNEHSTYIMKSVVTTGGASLSSTGDKEYGSNVAVSSEKYDTAGRMFEIRKSVDGLETKVSEVDIKVDDVEVKTSTQITQAVQDTKQVLFQAFEGYVQTGDYEQYQQSVSSQFQQLANSITLSIQTVTNSIDNVNNSLQEQVNDITKYFRFDSEGLWIGETGNEVLLNLDNDIIQFLRNHDKELWIDTTGLNANQVSTNRIKIGNMMIYDDNGKLTIARAVG